MASICIFRLTSTIIFLELSPPGQGEAAARLGRGWGHRPASQQPEVSGDISVTKASRVSTPLASLIRAGGPLLPFPAFKILG